MHNQPVGEKELLQWASKITNLQIKKRDDLRDGYAYVKIFSVVWPIVVNLEKLKHKPNSKTPKDIKANWDVIQKAMKELRLPIEVFDMKAIQSGKFKQTYNFLVMLYFLQNLSENHDLGVDFAHPIDGTLANFLQSTASVECLARGGGLKIEDIPRSFAKDLNLDQVQAVQADLQSVTSEVRSVSRQSSVVDNMSTYSEYSLKKISPHINEQSELLLSERTSVTSPTDSQKMNWDDDNESLIRQQMASKGTQTVLSSRKIEKILIRNMKGKHEIDNLRRMLEDAIERQSNVSPQSKRSDSDISVESSDLIWRNKNNKKMGELLLTKMRFEIESLNRQLAYVKQERDFAIKKLHHQIEEAKISHENELIYQRDLHRKQSTSQQLMLFNERMKDQNDYHLELKKIHDEISFEADRIRQGGLQAEDDDAIEDEILRLRQLRVIQTRKLKALEESNATLHELCDKLQFNLKMEQDKMKQLHESYMKQDETLFKDLIKQLVEAKHLDEIPQNLTSRERQLLNYIKILEMENQQNKNKFLAESEEYKLEIGKLKHQLSNKIPVEYGFDRELKIERLESEVERLKRANNYLRERSSIFDKYNEQHGHSSFIHSEEDEEDEENANVWVPSPYIGTSNDDMDIANSEMLAKLQQLKQIEQTASTAEELTKLFWKQVSDIQILQQRIRKAKQIIITQSKELQATKQELSTQKIQADELLNRKEREYNTKLSDLQRNFEEEKAQLLVKLQLAEDARREAKDELLEMPFRNSKLMELILGEDGRRFTVLKSKLVQAQRELAEYRLREKLWTQLIECQRKNIETTEQLAGCQDYEEALKINEEREKLDLEATQCVQQLQSLTQQHHIGIQKQMNHQEEKDQWDEIIQERTKALQEHIKKLEHDLKEEIQKREREIERARAIEVTMKEIQIQLEKEKKMKEELKKDYETIMDEYEQTKKELNEYKDIESQKVLQLQTKIEQLKTQLEEYQNHPYSFEKKENPYLNLQSTSDMDEREPKQERTQNPFDTEDFNGGNVPTTSPLTNIPEKELIRM